jgi:hypothetical protein
MGKAGLRTTDTSSQISIGLQLSLCRELAFAFRKLCKAVCDRYGNEGEMLIRDLFIADTQFRHGDAAPGKESSTRQVNVALVKLLACNSISSENGKIEH